MAIVWSITLVIVLALSWLSNLIGLPGNWIMVLAVALYAWWVPAESSVSISWNTVVALAALAALGELLELIAGAAGVSKVGGSRRSAVLALVGSLIGGIAGVFIGVPIPLVGSLVAAMVFAGLGALAGAVLGETWKGRDLDHSMRVGQAAFWGRIFGTLAKTLVGCVILAVALGALVL